MYEFTMNHQDSCSSGAQLWTTYNGVVSCSGEKVMTIGNDDAITTSNLYQTKRVIKHNNNDNNKNNKNTKFHQLRWVVMSIASIGFGLTLIYCDCMAVAIVAMARPQSDSDMTTNGSFSFGQTNRMSQNQTSDTSLIFTEQQQNEEFNWNNFIQSLVVNIYFIGYAVSFTSKFV